MTLATSVTKRYQWRRNAAGGGLGRTGITIADQVLGRYLTAPIAVAPVPLDHPFRRSPAELRLTCRFSWQTTLWLMPGRGEGTRRGAGGARESAWSVARAVRSGQMGGGSSRRTDPAPGNPQLALLGSRLFGGERLIVTRWLPAVYRLPDMRPDRPGSARSAGAGLSVGTPLRRLARGDGGHVAVTAAAAGRVIGKAAAAGATEGRLGSTVWRRQPGEVLATPAAGSGAAANTPGRVPSAPGDGPAMPRWGLPLVCRRAPGISSGCRAAGEAAPVTVGRPPTASGREEVPFTAGGGAILLRRPEPVPLVMAERASVPWGRGESAVGARRGTTAGPALEKAVPAVSAAIPGSTATEVAGVTKALAQLDLNRLTDEVCRQIERRLLSERERRGR